MEHIENWSSLNIEGIIHQTQGFVTVFRGTLTSDPLQQVAIKQLYVNDFQDTQELINEALNFTGINHPNIVKILGTFLSETNQNIDSIVIVMEFMPDGDLHKEIRRRMRTQEFWSGDELFGYFADLIGTFAFLEERGIAHRDIKPQNIFISKVDSGRVVLKIADFGCARRDSQSEVALRTIAGTPTYLSPLLRRGFLMAQLGREMGMVAHDIFKSDVYSLGITFLHMIRLRESTELGALDVLEERTNQILQNLPMEYMKVKEIVQMMLSVDERERSNFQQVKGWIERVRLSQGVTMGERDIDHPNSCTQCRNQRNHMKIPPCNHRHCENCIMQGNCALCLGIALQLEGALPGW